MWGSRETRTGRIVYDRKKHTFRASDLERIARYLTITGEFDVQLCSAALIWLELKIEDYANIVGNGLNLGEIYPLWNYHLKNLASSQWATHLQQKDPIAATTLGVILEAWQAYAAIRIAEKFKNAE